MRLLALALVAAALVPTVAAQQKIGYVDSSKILPQMPEFQSAQQELDRLAGTWQAEIAAAETEARQLADQFAAREILYTDVERQQQEAALEAKRAERDALRQRYFGPNGELFREQQNQLRPAQERLLAAIETVADDDEFDYVFDRAGEYVFLYARARHDLTDRVLQELGIGIGAAVAPGSTR